MSMFNDIVWNANDEKCVSNAEKVKNHAMIFSQGQWTLLGPGSEEKWYGSTTTLKRALEIAQPTKWYSNSKTLVILCSKVSP